MADKDHLESVLKGTKPASRPPEEVDALQNDVGPCGMVMPKGCRALDVERGGKFPVASFQYVYISVKAEFTPTEFWVVFAGLTHWKLTVEGRNLRPLYDRIQDHCVRRIRMADRDFAPDDGKPVITAIQVDDVTPTERE